MMDRVSSERAHTQASASANAARLAYRYYFYRIHGKQAVENEVSDLQRRQKLYASY